MMINLTTKSGHRLSPKDLLIVGHPKLGKTEALMNLPNSAIIDLQSGTDYVDTSDLSCTVYDVKKLVRENNIVNKEKGERLINMIDVYYEICKYLRANPVDYLTVDTVSDLEELAKEMAVFLYKNHPTGKNFKGNEVVTLPNGSGWNFIRIAFKKLLDELEGCYNKCLIYTVHPKTASIMKNGQDLQARDINISGKSKLQLCGDTSNIAFMYRDKSTNTNMISFKTDERDLSTGARCKHLRGQEFPISKLLENGNLETYWDKIFID